MYRLTNLWKINIFRTIGFAFLMTSSRRLISLLCKPSASFLTDTLITVAFKLTFLQFLLFLYQNPFSFQQQKTKVKLTTEGVSWSMKVASSEVSLIPQLNNIFQDPFSSSPHSAFLGSVPPKGGFL